MRDGCVDVASLPRLCCSQVLAHLVTNAAALLCLRHTWRRPVHAESLHLFDVLCHVGVGMLTVLLHGFHVVERIGSSTDLRAIVTKDGLIFFLKGTLTILRFVSFIVFAGQYRVIMWSQRRLPPNLARRMRSRHLKQVGEAFTIASNSILIWIRLKGDFAELGILYELVSYEASITSTTHGFSTLHKRVILRTTFETLDVS